MPDMKRIHLTKKVINVRGDIRISAPELLFNPVLKTEGINIKPIHKLAWQSILDYDAPVMAELCKNCVLVGGSSMFNGLAERLKDEIAR